MIKTLVVANCTSYWNLSYPSVRAAQASHTRLCQLGASRTSFYLSSHTRLRQLADFPSLILRSSFAEGSLKVWGILNFELGTSCKLAPAGG